MDANDMTAIGKRLQAMQRGFQELDAISQVYQQGEVRVVGSHFLPLTAGQKTTAKNVATGVRDKLQMTIQNVNQTGLAGTADAAIVAQFEAQPASAYQALVNYTQQLAQMMPELDMQEDGSANVSIDSNIAQRIADELATLTAGLTALIAVLNARLA